MVLFRRVERETGRGNKGSTAAIAATALLAAPLASVIGCGEDTAKAPIAARDGGDDEVVTPGCTADADCTEGKTCQEGACTDPVVEEPEVEPEPEPVPEPVECPSDESRVWIQVRVDDNEWISGTEGATFVIETNEAPVSYTFELDADSGRMSLVSQVEVAVPEIGTGILRIDLASGGVMVGDLPVPGNATQEAFSGNIAREVLPRLTLLVSDTETPTRDGTVALNVDGEVVVFSEMAGGTTSYESEAGTQVLLRKVTDNGAVVDVTNANGRREQRYLSREAGFEDSASSVAVVAVNDKSTEAAGTTVEVPEEGDAVVTPFACQETPAANLGVDVNGSSVVSPEVHGALEVGRIYSLGDGVGVEISKHVVDDAGVDVVELKVGEMVGPVGSQRVLGQNENVDGVQRFGKTVTLVAGGDHENTAVTFTMGEGDVTQTYTVTFSGIDSAE